MIIPTTADCSDQCPYFEADINTDGQTQGFKDWVKQITQCKHKIFLPDGT